MKLLGTLIIGISAIISAMVISSGLTDLRTGDRYVTVKGVAEREVNADLALWPIRFVATGDTLSQAQEKARSSREAIMAFLKLQAIDENAVELQRLAVTDTRANPYQNSNGAQQFIINQTLMVRSKDVEKIRQAAKRSANWWIPASFCLRTTAPPAPLMYSQGSMTSNRR